MYYIEEGLRAREERVSRSGDLARHSPAVHPSAKFSRAPPPPRSSTHALANYNRFARQLSGDADVYIYTYIYE